MSKWPEIPLGELTSVFNGKTPAKAEQRSSGHPVLKIRDVDEFEHFRGSFNSFVDDAFAKKNKGKTVVQGDSFILNAAHSASHVGSKTYFAEETTVGAQITGEWLVVRPEQTVCDPTYLHHWITLPSTKHRLSRMVKGIHLYPKDVARLTIPLPPLEEQRRIAAILDKADELRAKRREAIAKLDTLAQSIFIDMFGTLGSWPGSPFGSLAEKGRGKFSNGPFGSDLLTSELTDKGVPVIYIRDIREGEYKRVSKVFVTEKKAHALSTCQVIPGDVLISKVGDPPGVAAIYPPDDPVGIITQDVIRIRPEKSLVNPWFLVGYLNSEYGRRNIQTITVEATRARFGLRDLKSQEIPVPSLDVQNTYASAIESLHRARIIHIQSLGMEDQLFASLQQRAFKGEL